MNNPQVLLGVHKNTIFTLNFTGGGEHTPLPSPSLALALCSRFRTILSIVYVVLILRTPIGV